VTAVGCLPLISTNAGLGTTPVSKILVSPLALAIGANTAWADLYDHTSAIAAVRSGLALREPKNAGSTSDSSIALSTNPASLQPVAMNASFLPLSACRLSLPLANSAHGRVGPPPMFAVASSRQPRLVA
jgi:hypothetical protein